ncbi:MAG TPA: hypothetical protein PLR59_08745, partial [Brevundimonas sp.]|nr:hypothetical protein [Brevundimonas sp.]
GLSPSSPGVKRSPDHCLRPRFFDQPTCHWRPTAEGGVLAAEGGELLRAFFRARRKGTAAPDVR